MFVMTVKALSLKELRNKLQDSCDALSNGIDLHGEIEDDGGDDSDAIAFGYTPVDASPIGHLQASAPTAQPTAAPNLGPAAAPSFLPRPGVQAPQSTTGSAALDSRGIPWDERIHSSSKEFNKDGSWRNRRNLNKELLTQIEAQLLAARGAASVHTPQQAPMAGAGTHVLPGLDAQPRAAAVPVGLHQAPPASVSLPAAPQQYAQPPVVDAPVFQMPGPAQHPAQLSQPVQQAQVVPPQQQVSAPQEIAVPQGQQAAHTLDSFRASFIPTIGTLVEQKKLTQETLEQWRKYFDVKQIWDVRLDEAKSKQFFDTLCGAGLITKVG